MRKLIILLCACVLGTAWAVDSAPAFEDAVLQTRYENLTRQLRCLVCQNETIADSNATLAGDLRRELREQLAAGATDEQVLKFMTDRYGAFVLYKPPMEPRTWILWFGPAILLAIGLLVVINIIRKRAQMNPDADMDSSPTDAEGSRSS